MTASPAYSNYAFDPYANFPHVERDEMSRSPPYSVPLGVRNESTHKIEKMGSKFITHSLNVPSHFDQACTAQPYDNTDASKEAEDVLEGPRPTKRIPNEQAADWPHPKYCPLVRHNIKTDIPRRCRSLVRISYYVWQLTSFGLLWDLLSILTASLDAETHGWPTMTINVMCASIMFVAAVIPLSFLLCHMSLYRLCRLQSHPRRHLCLFASMFSIQMIFALRMIVGWPWNPITPCPSGFFFVKSMVTSGQGINLVFAMAAINTTIWMTVFLVGFVIIHGVYGKIATTGITEMEDQNADILEI